jgi:hypothetical protein
VNWLPLAGFQPGTLTLPPSESALAPSAPGSLIRFTTLALAAGWLAASATAGATAADASAASPVTAMAAATADRALFRVIKSRPLRARLLRARLPLRSHDHLC